MRRRGRQTCFDSDQLKNGKSAMVLRQGSFPKVKKVKDVNIIMRTLSTRDDIKWREDKPAESLTTCFCNCGCQKRTAVRIFLKCNGKCPDCREGIHLDMPTVSEWERIDSETKRLSSVSQFVDGLQ